MKVLDVGLRRAAGLLPDRAVRMTYLGSSVRVTPLPHRRVHRCYTDAAITLDVAKLPELFVSQDPASNTLCIGLDTPIIVVTSGLLDLMDDAELRCVLGHELGHAVSGHSAYSTLLNALFDPVDGVPDFLSAGSACGCSPPP